MNARQQRFVQEYLIDLNATQAAIRAGYSKKTARSIGQENLTKPDIAAAVKQSRAAAERAQITADMVLEELAKLAFGTMRDFFDPKDGHLLQVYEMSPTALSRLAAVDVGRERKRIRTSGDDPVTSVARTPAPLATPRV